MSRYENYHCRVCFLQLAVTGYILCVIQLHLDCPFVYSLKSIEKAIVNSDLGMTPNNDGEVIRLSLPQLTSERRKVL